MKRAPKTIEPTPPSNSHSTTSATHSAPRAEGAQAVAQTATQTALHELSPPPRAGSARITCSRQSPSRSTDAGQIQGPRAPPGPAQQARPPQGTPGAVLAPLAADPMALDLMRTLAAQLNESRTERAHMMEAHQQQIKDQLVSRRPVITALAFRILALAQGFHPLSASVPLLRFASVGMHVAHATPRSNALTF